MGGVGRAVKETHEVFASEVICHYPPLPSTGSHFTCFEAQSNQSQHKTNGVLVHSNSSVIQLLLYDIITLLANSYPETIRDHQL